MLKKKFPLLRFVYLLNIILFFIGCQTTMERGPFSVPVPSSPKFGIKDITDIKSEIIEQTEEKLIVEKTVIQPTKSTTVVYSQIIPSVTLPKTGPISPKDLFGSIPPDFDTYNRLYHPKIPLESNKKFSTFIFLLYPIAPDETEASKILEKLSLIGDALASNDLLITYPNKDRNPNRILEKLIIEKLFPDEAGKPGPFLFFINTHPLDFKRGDKYIVIDMMGLDLQGEMELFDFIVNFSKKRKLTSSHLFWAEIFILLKSEIREIFKNMKINFPSTFDLLVKK